jgi:HSP20 family molecular chaperone IbpA
MRQKRRGRSGLAAATLMARADLPRLTIRAERSDKTEGKHRSEFRYGSFNRAWGAPA